MSICNLASFLALSLFTGGRERYTIAQAKAYLAEGENSYREAKKYVSKVHLTKGTMVHEVHLCVWSSVCERETEF